MQILAGTSRGVFSIEPETTRRVLECRGVRDLVELEDRTFAGTGAGLYASDDAGESWDLVGLEDREVWQTRSSPDGALYAGTQPAGLFKSLDQGSSWQEIESFSNAPEASQWCIPVTPVRPGQARALVIDANNPKRLWVGVEVGGIMRSEDGGESWSLNLPGDNPDLHMMYAHPENSNVLFASTGYGRLDGVADMIEGNAGVFRSDDGGQNWKYVWRGITPRYSRPMCIDPRPPYALTIASAPTAFSSYKEDGGAQAMIFRSEDQGESWRSLCDEEHSPSPTNFHGLTTDAECVGGIVVGTDNGEVWRVSNDGQWQCLAQGLPAVLSLHTKG
jgi:photosystem II stability/assembly factor-like uncharacterized protein